MTTDTLTEAPGRRRRRRFSPLTLVCAAVALLLAVAAIAGQWIFPDYGAQDLLTGAAMPGGAHLLGTDELGRDIAQMVVAGARSTLAGAALVALGSMVIGNVLGLAAGYLGGLTDVLVRRWADLLLALPALLVTLVVAGIGGGGYLLAVAVLVVLTSPGDVRLVRSAVLEQRHRAYVEAAETLGLSRTTVMVRHIWPNVLPVVVANTMLNFAGAIVALSSLSFLGLGVLPGAPDWGRMLAENRTLLYDNPSAALAPALAIVVSAVVLNLLGDRLFEIFSDRRS
ncbi:MULTISPECIES: ABC transporter permease [unclassified Streptomyces]|uniref:ABC transporter permease n=1 Tax=unclassified Streptomyces TaxID=2593676 RepID=UPI000DBA0257|nr:MULTISPECIES: ABC transporter permease [unclassified Streptomyces]MYT74396.1 ABC transporter permease subunit [Streptomyces sp. SID8367]RAJ91373.1 peptide/nickel transport system permease protein [Streptomyces sp. PsTaAH-137]